MLPRPPITTTAKASTMSSMPISLVAAVAGRTRAPPTVPSATRRVNTRTETRVMSTPRASLISRFSAVARTMRPNRVRVSSQPMPSAIGPPAAIPIRLYAGTAPHASRDTPARRDHDQVVDRDGGAPHAQLAVHEVHVTDLVRRRAPDEPDDVLEHEHEREGQQELEALVAVVDGPHDPLDRRPDDGQRQPGGQQHEHEQRGRHAGPQRPR